MRRFVTVLGLVVVLAAGGCGGDDGGDAGGNGGGGSGSQPASSEEKAARDAVQKYIAALVDRDPEAACAMQTREAQEAAANEVPGAGSCERAHEIILGALGARVDDLEGALTKALSEVEVSGDTAKLTSPKQPGKELKLRREDGEWKVVHRHADPLPGSASATEQRSRMERALGDP